MSPQPATMPDDVMEYATYEVDPKREAAARALVTRDAYNDGVECARRGWPRRASIMPAEFKRAWYAGYDAMRTHGAIHAEARTKDDREHGPRAVSPECRTA